MPRPVYTVPFFIYGAEDSPTSFEVPMGYTAVLRDFTGIVAAAGYDYFQINLVSEAGVVPIFYQTDLASLMPLSWQGRVAVPEGYTIEIDGDSVASVHTFVLSGYLLLNSG